MQGVSHALLAAGVVGKFSHDVWYNPFGGHVKFKGQKSTSSSR